jgi:flavin reductase (DIM6/NTAB) family NADH-FMN oxidoreductase RutF
MTVNAVTSLSLTPPQLLVCLQRDKYTLQAVAESGHFGVNFLAVNQGEIAAMFASPAYNKFSQIRWSTGFVSGVPKIKDVAAFAECDVAAIFASGDHEIVVGDLIAGSASGCEPLVYHDRQYRRLAR